MNDTLLWQIRHFVYQHFAETTLPPSVEDTAAHFNISTKETREYYKVLHNLHFLFLDINTHAILVADPFTGIPTDFKVHTKDKTYFAKCFWDAFGITAALHSNNAVIEAICTGSNKSVQLEITNGQVTNNDILVHFSPPPSRSYENLVFT